MLVRRPQPVRLECIARGYLFGAAWSEYQEHGHGARPPAARPGCRRPSGCPEPIFTPTTKADERPRPPAHRRRGRRARRRRPASSELRDVTLAVYRFGAAHAAERGLILADTKFEFGLVDGELARDRRGADARLVALLAAPTTTCVGTSPPSFDKQYVRDYYLSIGWNQEPPAPHLPGVGDRGHAGALRRGLRAGDRQQLRRLVRRRRHEVTRPASTSPTSPASLDPQGATVERALPALGYANVTRGARSARPSAWCSTPTPRPRRGRRSTRCATGCSPTR